MTLLRIYPENPSEKHIMQVVETLQNGGIIIIPTDSVYGIACDINNSKAVDKLARLKGVKIETPWRNTESNSAIPSSCV